MENVVANADFLVQSSCKNKKYKFNPNRAYLKVIFHSFVEDKMRYFLCQVIL